MSCYVFISASVSSSGKRLIGRIIKVLGTPNCPRLDEQRPCFGGALWHAVV